MEWMLMPLKRYADFSGRSRRKEYWLYTLGVAILTVALIIGLGVAIFSTDDGKGNGAEPAVIIGLLVMFLCWSALIVPSLAVQVRRFHDQDKSGWMVLLNFIPYIGPIVVLVFMCLEGTPGSNRFGPDPKDERVAQVFA